MTTRPVLSRQRGGREGDRGFVRLRLHGSSWRLAKRAPRSIRPRPPTSKDQLLTLLRRLVGVLLVLAGGAALALGLWFHNFLGPGGMARFSVEPVGSTPVVIEPSVLNRTGLPVTISVTPAAGATASIVVGTPSDAAAALGDTVVDVVGPVSVRDRTAPVTRRGTDANGELASVDVWRTTKTADGPTEISISQASAPETVVISPSAGGELDSVTLAWTRETWARQTMGLIVGGATAAVAGLAAAVWPRRRREVTR